MSKPAASTENIVVMPTGNLVLSELISMRKYNIPNLKRCRKSNSVELRYMSPVKSPPEIIEENPFEIPIKVISNKKWIGERANEEDYHTFGQAMNFLNSCTRSTSNLAGSSCSRSLIQDLGDRYQLQSNAMRENYTMRLSNRSSVLATSPRRSHFASRRPSCSKDNCSSEQRKYTRRDSVHILEREKYKNKQKRIRLLNKFMKKVESSFEGGKERIRRQTSDMIPVDSEDNNIFAAPPQREILTNTHLFKKGGLEWFRKLKIINHPINSKQNLENNGLLFGTGTPTINLRKSQSPHIKKSKLPHYYTKGTQFRRTISTQKSPCNRGKGSPLVLRKKNVSIFLSPEHRLGNRQQNVTKSRDFFPLSPDSTSRMMEASPRTEKMIIANIAHRNNHAYALSKRTFGGEDL